MNLNTIFLPKQCTKCGQVKSFSKFPVVSYAYDLLRARCDECISSYQRQRRINNPRQKELDRKYNLRADFGLTAIEYEQILVQQNGVCAICKKPETAIRLGIVNPLCVDHYHKTGENRGLLCSRCNLAIGYFKESINTLQTAIKYLEQYI